MRGVSLVELVVTLTIAGAVAALVLPKAWRWTDRLAVRRAAYEVAVFYHAARQTAVVRGTRVRIEFRTDTLQAFVEGEPDSLALNQPGPARHDATLTASRATVTIQPTGLGWGAANTMLVLQRGSAAESLTTSRLGRLRRW